MGKASLQPTCPLRVLVVDDFDDARDSLCMLLRIWGCQAEPAADGPQALAAAPAFRPHVVLIELALPGMDGYETARRLGELPQLARLVAVTTCAAGRRPPENAPRGVRRACGQARGAGGTAGTARAVGGTVSPGEGGRGGVGSGHCPSSPNPDVGGHRNEPVAGGHRRRPGRRCLEPRGLRCVSLSPAGRGGGSDRW